MAQLMGAAPHIGEQRSVEIDPAEFGNVQKSGGDDLAVSDDDDAVRREMLQNIPCFERADFSG